MPEYVTFDGPEAGVGWSSAEEGLRVTMIRFPRNEVPRGAVRLLVRDEKERILVELRTDASRFGPRWADTFLADYMGLIKDFTEHARPG
ncbi:hypothetical protein [Streptomyces hygroscopicus]|uniref:hypothetical protein n=1 Tax=Streptomyces hygroscopicus TaxID=1912 RepID=UPI0007671B02|nr:hypothetical protein [Streptomyces hygroscopicus]GLV74576.1 hypothetical protein Shyhy02_25770 [Streptomyces hygroscopicus subsp. hygroscopicus]